MLEIEAFTLKNTRFKETYIRMCHEHKTIVHLTFTLNPALNNADFLTQYRSMIKEIKSSNLFYYKTQNRFTIHPGFIRLMLVPELTSTINTHLHGILIVDPQYATELIQRLKKLCWNNPVLGRQNSFKIVNDTFKDRAQVSEYAFKDIEQLSKFEQSNKMYLLDFYNK